MRAKRFQTLKTKSDTLEERCIVTITLKLYPVISTAGRSQLKFARANSTTVDLCNANNYVILLRRQYRSMTCQVNISRQHALRKLGYMSPIA